MSVARTSSPDETELLGEAIGRVLHPGDVLGLTGALGAGKTRLVHGIVRGLLAAAGEETSGLGVRSPSYTVINTYERGSVRVHHLDLYRLGDVDDLESTGYWDVLDDTEATTLIEWVRQVGEAFTEDTVELRLEATNPSDPDSSPREISVGFAGNMDCTARVVGVLSGWGQ